jgi:hypothetical protein
VGSINVFSVSYLLDSLIHMACGSESLAHLYPNPDKPEPKRLN